MPRIKNLIEAIERTSELSNDLFKKIVRSLDHCWLVDQLECAQYLSDEEFEQLQGLIKKAELKKEIRNEKKIT